MNMKTIIIVVTIFFSIAVIFFFAFLIKQKKTQAIISAFFTIAMLFFTCMCTLYPEEIKSLLPRFDNSTKIVTTTEPATASTTEPTTTTIKPSTTVKPSTNTTNSNNIISIHGGNTYISGNSVNATLSSNNSELSLKYKAQKTGKYRLNFDILNQKNKYSIAVIDFNNKTIANSYLSNDSLTLELTQNEEYTIIITATSYIEDFNVNIKLNFIDNKE